MGMGARGMKPPPRTAERRRLLGSEEGCPAGAIRALSLLAMWCSRCSLWWWDAAAAGHLKILKVVGEITLL